MKKRLFLTFILSLFLMPMIAKADMSAPTFTYAVRVNNPNGAQAYDTEWAAKEEKLIVKKDEKTGIVKYDTTLYVATEEKIDGKDYLYVGFKKDTSDFIVKAEDVEVAKDRVNYKDYENSTPKTGVVFREGAYLYDGPSYKFGKTKDNYMIPVGTTIKSYYYDEIFAYVEVDGHKGWVYIYEYNGDISPYGTLGYIASKPSDVSYPEGYFNTLYTAIDLKAYKELANEKSESVTIPTNTKLEIDLVYSYEPHNSAYRVKYNGDKYWVVRNDTNIKLKNIDKNYVVLFDKAKIYKYPGDDNNYYKGDTGKIIPKYTKLIYENEMCLDYGEGCFYEVTYDGTTGWIINDSEKAILEYSGDLGTDYSKKYVLASDLKVYSNLDKKSNEKTISKGTEVELIYLGYVSKLNELNNKLVYMVSKGAEGWIIFDESMISNSSEIIEIPEKPEKDPEPEIKKPTKKPIKSNKDEETNKVMFYSIIGCSAVVLIGISVLVLTIFINKKKKKAALVNDEVKVEKTSIVKEEVKETPSEDLTLEKPKKSKTKKEKTDN